MKSCPRNFFSSQGLCLPYDEQLRSQYLENSHVSNGHYYESFKTALFWSAIVALGFGLLWMTLVWCAPRHAPLIAHVGSAILLIAIGVLILVLWDKYKIDNSSFWSHNNGLKIFTAIVCFLLAIILIVMLCFYANERKFQGIFLEYAKRFLSEKPDTFAYIPVFILLTIGLFALIVWQHCCFASKFATNNNFWDFNNTGFWEVMNILELIWGLQFLRDACNEFITQSPSAYQDVPLTGISTDLKRLDATPPTKDLSANTGAALLVDLSSMLSLTFLHILLNSSHATPKPVAVSSELAATTAAAFSLASSIW